MGERWLDEVEALYAYEGALRRALMRFKFGGDLSRARGLAERLCAAGTFTRPIDVLTWVPSHPLRRLRRGFEHTRELAFACAGALGPACPAPRPLLRRTRDTAPQSSLPAGERNANVRGVFELARRADVKRRSIVVLDDVTTTGATLREAMSTLRAGGATRVTGVCLLRSLELN